MTTGIHLGRSRLLLVLLIVVCAQSALAQIRSGTLYSPLKYPSEFRDYCLKFKSGLSPERDSACDLTYGSLYVGEDKDWFQGALHRNSRSVIKDLGPHSWDDEFRVPEVAPQPKLLPGEERRIGVDASGADGADGAPGRPGMAGADGDGVVREPIVPPAPRPVPSRNKPKKDGKPKVDPVFVKAVVGHMYVIHVVDNQNDFYALFRVEEIKRGDHCVVSWRVMPSDWRPPQDKTAASVNQ